MNKRGLCAYDDKRYLLADGVHSLAYGHHSIPAKVHAIEPEEPAQSHVLTAAQARLLRIPLAKRKVLPAGHDPRMTLLDARRTRAAIAKPIVQSAHASAHTTLHPLVFPPLPAAATAPDPAESNEIEDLLEFILEDTL